MRPIDADELINNLAKAIPHIIDDVVTDAYVEGLGRAKIEIERMPTIESEQKTGKWIKYDDRFMCNWICSECDSCSDERTDYCPMCGAKMEVEER